MPVPCPLFLFLLPILIILSLTLSSALQHHNHHRGSGGGIALQILDAPDINGTWLVKEYTPSVNTPDQCDTKTVRYVFGDSGVYDFKRKEESNDTSTKEIPALDFFNSIGMYKFLGFSAITSMSEVSGTPQQENKWYAKYEILDTSTDSSKIICGLFTTPPTPSPIKGRITTWALQISKSDPVECPQKVETLVPTAMNCKRMVYFVGEKCLEGECVGGGGSSRNGGNGENENEGDMGSQSPDSKGSNTKNAGVGNTITQSGTTPFIALTTTITMLLSLI